MIKFSRLSSRPVLELTAKKIDPMIIKNFNCAYLIRNFHVFACSAMSKLEMMKQISSRL